MKKSYHDLNQESIIRINDLGEFDRDVLQDKISEHSYAIVRGLFNQAILRECVKRLSSKFDLTKDSASHGEAKERVRENFQKLSAGGASLRYNNFPRLFRTFYNPLWAEDIYGMHHSFRLLIRLRNLIYGIDEDFAIAEPEKNGLWSATRIHQYPKGGGFFDGHIDSTLLDVARDKKTNFYQLILTMSQKGTDYMNGGAFVERDDKRYLIEDICEVGDVLVYDGRSFHGVEDIDETEKLDFTSVNGRIVAMASLYSL